jgi:hypothetical protein
LNSEPRTEKAAKKPFQKASAVQNSRVSERSNCQNGIFETASKKPFQKASAVQNSRVSERSNCQNGIFETASKQVVTVG